MHKRLNAYISTVSFKLLYADYYFIHFYVFPFCFTICLNFLTSSNVAFMYSYFLFFTYDIL